MEIDMFGRIIGEVQLHGLRQPHGPLCCQGDLPCDIVPYCEGFRED
jgi:hypothetical protein